MALGKQAAKNHFSREQTKFGAFDKCIHVVLNYFAFTWQGLQIIKFDQDQQSRANIHEFDSSSVKICLPEISGQYYLQSAPTVARLVDHVTIVYKE